MSEKGYPLHFDTGGKAICKGNGDEYFLKDGVVSKSK
jgi:hypothetical protein